MPARASLDQFHDANDTLEMTNTLVLDRRSMEPTSGVWLAPAKALPIESLDPVLSTLHDAPRDEERDDAAETWQSDSVSSADASQVVAPVKPEVATRALTARPIPHPNTSLSPDGSLQTWQQNGTISPDLTLLPWRQPAPPSRWGTIACAVLIALTAAGVASFGYAKTSKPVAIAARIARTPSPGVRHLELVDSALSKREQVAVAAPAPVKPKKARPRPAPQAAADVTEAPTLE